MNSLQKENSQLQTSLAQSQQNGVHLVTSLNQSQEKISQLQAETEHLKAVVVAMEGSGSRIFRQAWLRLKRAVGMRSE